MATTAATCITRIQDLDAEIVSLRERLRAAQELRSSLVTTLAGILGDKVDMEFRTPAGRVTCRPVRQVQFPTQSSDPAAQLAVMATLKRASLWEHFSLLSYARLKSAWLSDDRLLRPCRADLAGYAEESVGLRVTTGMPSRQLPGRTAQTDSQVRAVGTVSLDHRPSSTSHLR
jgi:hypothetical protein